MDTAFRPVEIQIEGTFGDLYTVTVSTKEEAEYAATNQALEYITSTTITESSRTKANFLALINELIAVTGETKYSLIRRYVQEARQKNEIDTARV